MPATVRSRSIALELSDSTQHGVEHLASRRPRVDVFSQRSQRNVAAAQQLGHLEQILQATSEPIELPDYERVAAGKLVNRALQAVAIAMHPRPNLRE
jgi:hypothetical protein